MFSPETSKVSMSQQSSQLPKSKVADANGNPVELSAIINWRITDAAKWIYNINGDASYIRHQADAIIKQVGSKYPYECSDNTGMSLKGETAFVTEEMITELQKRCNLAGVTIDTVSFSDLNYAPEIAAQMLIRQQAKAYVDAREEIAKASVSIVEDTLNQLKSKGIISSEKVQDEICRNLITVICSGAGATTTLPLAEHQ